jgi:hypothetical protein
MSHKSSDYTSLRGARRDALLRSEAFPMSWKGGTGVKWYSTHVPGLAWKLPEPRADGCMEIPVKKGEEYTLSREGAIGKKYKPEK